MTNRLEFARWLFEPEHPLTARVAANRIWQQLFGHGLVRTPEDFGSQGELPTHPRLLDWLATEFVRLDWDVKALFKTILLSETYRQSSARTPGLAERDPDNRYYARASRLKLSGNVLRDQALLASGLLERRIGGPSVKPYQPENLWSEASNFKYRPSQGSDLYRRSLYTYWKRTLAPPILTTLDAPGREFCAVRRKQTNTPLQALALLNETGFVECARKLAERMLTARDPLEDPIVFGFLSVATRRPKERELNILAASFGRCLEYYQKHPRHADALLSAGESPADASLPKAELAAMTAAANTLLNLEEVTTRE